MRTPILVAAMLVLACAPSPPGSVARHARRPPFPQRVPEASSAGAGAAPSRDLGLDVAVAGAAGQCALRRSDVEAIRDAVVAGIDEAMGILAKHEEDTLARRKSEGVSDYDRIKSVWFHRRHAVQAAIEGKLGRIETTH